MIWKPQNLSPESLSEAERLEIEAELHHHAFPRGASIESLKIIQRHRGWVSDEALRGVANYLGMSPEELENVATFYNLIFRKPVGRRVIHLCDSVSCWIKGCDVLRDRIHKNLGIGFGETTRDNRFTLLPIQCLGNCDHAPCMMVDEDLCNDVDEHSLDRLLEKYD